LLAAVRAGVRRADAPFAYVTGAGPAGHHTGIVYRQNGAVYFDEQSLLVHPDHLVYPPPSEGVGDREQAMGDTGPVTGDTPVPSTLPPAPSAPSRFYGRVKLDPQRLNKEMAVIVEEVIERLTTLVGAEVEITLEIDGRLPQGFDENSIRTINENSRTLKFERYGFEEG
jgi:hypothetical protein